MRFVPGFCLALLCLSHAAEARRSPPVEGCAAAIGLVESEGGVPPHLLGAIGLVESGRRDPRSGVWAPWPWTIDAAGQPAFFDTKDQAVAAVRTLRALGVGSIDVGCMQVNLAQHPLAFDSLDQAFDPLANVRYAARFLGSLFARSKAWPEAAGLYHSATPALGDSYRRRVMAVWPEGTHFQATAAVAVPLTRASALQRAWAATLSGEVAASGAF